MQVWSTQIPVNPSKTTADLAALCEKWITGSPHHSSKEFSIPRAHEGEIRTVDHCGQRISVAKATEKTHQYFGFQHSWKDESSRMWTTDVIGWHCGLKFLVGVHLKCQTSGIGIRVPAPKKPYIVQQIITELGGDIDGEFEVTDTPRYLAESEIDVAKRILIGQTKHYLPIIYVSSTWKNTPALNAENLAKWASGMAHVVVEPSRSFSFILASQVERRNPYEGAVLINWPKGGGAPSKLVPTEYDSQTTFASAIANIVRKALAGRRPDSQVTWDYLRELILRDTIARMRSEGSRNTDQFIKVFDEELKLINQRADELEEENALLKRTLARYENIQKYPLGGTDTILKIPEERELFPGEFQDTLVRALHRARANSIPDGRVAHILDSFLKINFETGNSTKIENEIRSALDGCTNINTKEHKALEEAGFCISEEGKHYKLVFRGDDRYTFSMAKTGSDWRGMKNWLSSTTRHLFK